MKKILFCLLLFSSCVNPSMERGFANINEALLEISEDLTFYVESITSDLAQIEEDLYIISAYVDKMVKDKELALILIAEILEGLDRVQENLDEAATKEQAQALLAQVEELGEGIQILWNLADFDYDGVINAIDKCPETPLSLINEVDFFGCAPGEVPVTDTESSTLQIETDE